MGEWLADSEAWVRTAIVLAAALIAVALAHRIVFAVLRRITTRTASPWDDGVVRKGRGPTLGIVLALALSAVLPAVDLGEQARFVLQRAGVLLLMASIGWLAAALVRLVEEVVISRHDITADDNLQARQIYTQVRMLRRILVSVIFILTLVAMLMVFPSVRQIGLSLFASAGIAGLVLGMAARPALSNIIAGVQLALTQPIRIDDVVIVEGEWGWIEEIRTTFVVVRIWDLRRLVVPLTYFIEKPFQNWTRTTADILGTVYLYCDYTVPVGEVRDELHRILRESEEWDGRTWNLQVTNAGERTVELRALMGAKNSGAAWNLRCHVRERLLDWLQREHPEDLPRMRAELDRQDRVDTGGAD
jgi:small-conductance mechanosensitive channel